MTKDEIFSVIIEQQMVDEMLKLLFDYSMSEKKTIKNTNKEQHAALRAIRKIAKSTGNVDAIQSLCEDVDETGHEAYSQRGKL